RSTTIHPPVVFIDIDIGDLLRAFLQVVTNKIVDALPALVSTDIEVDTTVFELFITVIVDKIRIIEARFQVRIIEILDQWLGILAQRLNLCQRGLCSTSCIAKIQILAFRNL